MIEKAQFHLHDDHLKLLASSLIGFSWCEFGAVEINPKRPYGNSSVVGDIMELLGFGFENVANIIRNENGDIEDSEFIEEYETYFRRVHRQTEYALRIALSVMSKGEIPKPGIYETEERGGIYFAHADWNFLRPSRESDPIGFLSYDGLEHDFRGAYKNERQYYCGVCGGFCENLTNPIDRRMDIRCVCGTMTQGGQCHTSIPLLVRPKQEALE